MTTNSESSSAGSVLPHVEANRFASWSTDQITARLRNTHGVGYEITDLLLAAADRLDALYLGVQDVSSATVATHVLNCTHELKVWPEYFDAIRHGLKTFEFQKDDRAPRFEGGDTLRLREYDGGRFGRTHDYTGRECMRRVTYVARGGVIPDGYCVMSIVPVSSSSVLPESATPTISSDLNVAPALTDTMATLLGSLALCGRTEQADFRAFEGAQFGGVYVRMTAGEQDQLAVLANQLHAAHSTVSPGAPNRSVASLMREHDFEEPSAHVQQRRLEELNDV